jgi:hypothetical protein
MKLVLHIDALGTWQSIISLLFPNQVLSSKLVDRSTLKGPWNVDRETIDVGYTHGKEHPIAETEARKAQLLPPT